MFKNVVIVVLSYTISGRPLQSISLLSLVWVSAGLILLLILGLTTCGWFRMQRKRHLNVTEHVWVRQDSHVTKNTGVDGNRGQPMWRGQPG